MKQVFVLMEQGAGQLGDTTLNLVGLGVTDQAEAEKWKESKQGRDYKPINVVEKVNYTARDGR